MKTHIVLCVLVVLLAACENPGAEVPINGMVAALHFCPVDECKNIEIGSTTRQLSFRQSDGIYDRWCVAVTFERDGKSQRAAVVIEQMEPEDDYGNWGAVEPVYNSDCSAFK
jgi:hypothetical protein